MTSDSRAGWPWRLGISGFSYGRLLANTESSHKLLPDLAWSDGFTTLAPLDALIPRSAQSMYELASAAAKRGVDLPMLICDHIGGLADMNSGSREMAIQMCREWCFLASKADIREVRFNVLGMCTDRREAMQFASESISRVLDDPTSAVQLVIENHSPYTSDPDWLAELLERFDGTVGVLIDTQNFDSGVDPYVAIGRLVAYPARLAAKFPHSPAGGESHGGLDFARVATILRSGEFEGDTYVEYGGDSDPHPAVQAAAQVLRRSVGRVA